MEKSHTVLHMVWEDSGWRMVLGLGVYPPGIVGSSRQQPYDLRHSLVMHYCLNLDLLNLK